MRLQSDYNLSIGGTVPTLRKRLSQHLMQLEARVTKNMLLTNVPLSKPAAVCVASDDLLLCTDEGHRVVYQIQLERNGVTINGRAYGFSSSSCSSSDIFLKADLMYCKSVPAVSVVSIVLRSFTYSLKQILWTVSAVPVGAVIPVILELF